MTPSLSTRISSLLSAFPSDPVADVLATVAQNYAAVGLASANVVSAAVNTASDLLDRWLTAAEASALEACIRAHIEAGPP